MRKTFLFLFILLATFSSLHSQSLRPIRDDVGFCWNANEMNSFINYLSGEVKFEKPDGKLIGGISVHDDYLYAGKIYYPLFSQIRAKEVVIFGVTHGTVRKEMSDPKNVLIFDEHEKWIGPYGNVEISPLRELIKNKLDNDYIMVSNKAHQIEHSIESLVPFLQHYNRDIKITPIMITQMSYERMVEISKKLTVIILDYVKKNNLEIGKDILFLISNDANHYGEDFTNSPYGLDANAHQVATDNDKRIIKENLSGQLTDERIINLTKELWPDPDGKRNVPIWCGRYPMVFGLLTIKKIMEEVNNKPIMGELFSYSDTFTEKVLPFKKSSMGLTAPFSYRHWCGWFTLGLYVK
ncbi:MAG: AmmeMemoRadiSam system protein B [Ignavibacteria bacterium]|nr:AmmeMemoRadiSam system protein B [Ignavibacteria bacterium]